MTKAPVAQIVLPEQLTSSVDLSRITRELENLDESLRQNELRKPGAPTQLARSSVTLEELASLNKVALTDKGQRTQLLQLLKMFYKSAPRIHMSLAAEPSAKFTQKIVVWLRANINPIILLDVGLQPTLAAGCMIRTPNKVFDMSLRHRLTENRHVLVEKITEIGNEAEAEFMEESAAKAAAAKKMAEIQAAAAAAPAPAAPAQTAPAPAAPAPVPTLAGPGPVQPAAKSIPVTEAPKPVPEAKQ